jgi:hypothetical protein
MEDIEVRAGILSLGIGVGVTTVDGRTPVLQQEEWYKEGALYSHLCQRTRVLLTRTAYINAVAPPF